MRDASTVGVKNAVLPLRGEQVGLILKIGCSPVGGGPIMKTNNKGGYHATRKITDPQATSE